MRDNKPYAYRVTFFGDTVDLKDLLGDELDALDWLNNFSTDYDMNTVKIGLTTGLDKTVDSVTYNDALIVPMITHTRLFYNSGATGSADTEYPNASGGNLYYQTGSHHHHGVY